LQVYGRRSSKVWDRGCRQLIVIPEDIVIVAADREGSAPIDSDVDAPGVAAVVRLAERLAGASVPV